MPNYWTEELMATRQRLRSLTGSSRNHRIPVPTSIAETIRARILKGEMVSGDRIAENTLSAEFSAGQPSVREALFILERQGLVKRVPNLGTFVTELGVREVANYHRIRVELEGLASEYAARYAQTEDFKELRRLVDKMHSAAVSGDKWAYLQSDLAFHRKIWALSRNEKLADVLESIVVPLMVFGFMKVVRLAGFEEYASQAHNSLVEALAKGSDQARSVIQANLRRSLDNYLEHSL
jgi:DNA-binding GntR family transcriptional regulator